ncbi:MAG: transcriptional repressor [Ruminococcus sp.]|nr:transcriptional repressor [Ruminococcus sp.]
MPKYATKQRKILIDFLSSHPDESFSASLIADALSDKISKSAVYRNLSDMEAEGRLRRVVSGREVLYQYADSDSCREHLHLSCKKCGRTYHMEQSIAELLIDNLNEKENFSIDKGETVLYGICGSCREGKK